MIAGLFSAPFLIAVFLAIGLAQLLVWLVARRSTHVEIWRVIPLAVAGVASGTLVRYFYSEAGPVQVIGFALAGAFFAWILIGWVYEMETVHRVIIALSTPAIGTLAFLGGDAIFGELLRQVGA